MAWSYKAFTAGEPNDVINQATGFIQGLPPHVVCCVKTSQSNQHHGSARMTIYFNPEASASPPAFPAGPAWEVQQFKDGYDQNYQAVADQLNKLDINQAYYAKVGATNGDGDQETASVWWLQNQQ